MLPLKNRLTQKSDFQAISKNGYCVFSDELLLKFINNNTQTTRFAFVISKKVSKKAVERNKLKRFLKKVALKNIPLLKTNNDILIIVKPKIIAADINRIKEVFEKALKKANLYIN